MMWRAISSIVTVFGLWTACAHLCLLLRWNLHHLMVLFGLALVALLFLWRRFSGASKTAEAMPAEELGPKAVGFLCLCAAALAWIARSPSPDDALYLHLATAAADHPDEALMSRVGLFGSEAPSAMLRPYFLHSLELMAAALHELLGIRPIVVMHALLPPLAACFVVLVHLQLARVLWPGRALAIGIGGLLYLLLVAEGWQSHGRHGFDSFSMGRALFANGLLPVVFLATLRMHEERTVWSVACLSLSLFAAVGASANALALGPICALITYGACTGGTMLRPRNAILILAAAAPVLRLALWAYGYRSDLHPPGPTNGPEAAREVVERAFGNWWLMSATLAAVAFGIWGIASTAARRACLLILAALVLLTLNPLTAGFLNGAIMREGLLARMWWLLPIPILVSGGMNQIVRRLRLPARFYGLSGVAVLVAVFVALPGRSALPADINRDLTRLLNVYPQYRVAEELVQHAGPDAVVLSTQWASIWIPTVSGHPRLFYARELYEGYLADEVGVEEARRRRRLSLFVDGDSRVADYDPGCEDFDGIDVIVAGARAERANSKLEACGWQFVLKKYGYAFWSRVD